MLMTYGDKFIVYLNPEREKRLEFWRAYDGQIPGVYMYYGDCSLGRSGCGFDLDS